MVNSFLDNLGELLVKEIKKQIILMDLVDISDYLDSIKYIVKDGSLFVYSEVDYAAELEYGTYKQKSSSEESFPSTATASKALKKKDLDSKTAKSLPKGMVAFAPFRRVLYNQKKMDILAQEASLME